MKYCETILQSDALGQNCDHGIGREAFPLIPALPTNHKVGRVTPCAPPSLLTSPDAHGVTRPTTAARFRGSMGEKFRRILSPKERENRRPSVGEAGIVRISKERT